MENIKNYIAEVTAKYDFPTPSTEDFLNASDIISTCQEAKRLFDQQIRLYEEDLMCSFKGAFINVRKAAELCDARKETVNALYLLCLTEHLHRLYAIRELDETWYDGIIDDLRIKNDECRLIKGVSGTFVPEWYYKFFDLTRFAMGRLQFEPMFMQESNSYNGDHVEKDEFSIGIHIPGGSRLDIGECMKALRMAYNKFRPYFADGVVLFNCSSWLLAPDNKKLLDTESNIVKFGELFNVIPSEQHVDHDFWRIYGREDCSDIASLPRDNSVRKAYALCAERFEIPNAGLGIIRMKDGEIIK